LFWHPKRLSTDKNLFPLTAAPFGRHKTVFQVGEKSSVRLLNMNITSPPHERPLPNESTKLVIFSSATLDDVTWFQLQSSVPFQSPMKPVTVNHVILSANSAMVRVIHQSNLRIESSVWNLTTDENTAMHFCPNTLAPVRGINEQEKCIVSMRTLRRDCTSY
jgi:hypothetical protein